MMPRHTTVAIARPRNRRIGCRLFSFGSFGSFGGFAEGSLRLLFTFTFRPVACGEDVPPSFRWIFCISFLEMGIAS